MLAGSLSSLHSKRIIVRRSMRKSFQNREEETERTEAALAVWSQGFCLSATGRNKSREPSTKSAQGKL